MIVLRLPWPPSVNHYWRHVGGRTLISREGRAYRRHVNSLVLANGDGGMGRSRLQVKVDCYPPDRRRRDLDNLLKPLLDALESAGIYDDDSQIDDLSIRRMPLMDSGLIVIRVLAIDS